MISEGCRGRNVPFGKEGVLVPDVVPPWGVGTPKEGWLEGRGIVPKIWLKLTICYIR